MSFFLLIVGDSTQVYVTWSTMNITQNATCLYGVGSLTQQAKGTTTKFVDGGTEQHTQYIHRVVLTHLQPGKKHSEILLRILYTCTLHSGHVPDTKDIYLCAL